MHVTCELDHYILFSLLSVENVILCFTIVGLPAVYANKRIGERWMQVIGGTLMTAGIGATAFTTSAAQAIFTTGVCSGKNTE